MKRFLTFFFLLPVSAFAEVSGDFSATDKVLYFNSDVLIDVIKSTFPENLQLDVANMYVDLMDEKGNVSVADLVSVCGTGNLDNAQCRRFIRDLIEATDAGLKPFYWADYASLDWSTGLNIYNSGDGYFNDNAGLNNGDWALQFPWMRYKSDSFKKQYPDTEYLLGTTACTTDSGTEYMPDNTKNYAPNTQTGEHCWCKMTAPEESAWVYYGGKTPGFNAKCERSCALSCMTSLRDKEQMRRAMFTAIKLNNSNANTNTDNSIKSTLVAAVTPPPPPQPAPKPAKKPTKCTFDWEYAAEHIGGQILDGGRETVRPFLDFYISNDVYNEYKKVPHTYIEQFRYVNNTLKYNEWMVKPEFMNTKEFQCRYPGTKYIKGEARIVDKECECRMTAPETSAWWRQNYGGGAYGGKHSTLGWCSVICGYNFSWHLAFNTKDVLKALGKK